MANVHKKLMRFPVQKNDGFDVYVIWKNYLLSDTNDCDVTSRSPSHVWQWSMEQREDKIFVDARITWREKTPALAMNKMICTNIEVIMIDPEGSLFELR